MTDTDRLLGWCDNRAILDPWTRARLRDIDDVHRHITDLAAEIRRLRARPCPWVETSDGGTSHCTLAAAIGGHVCDVCGQPPVEHAEVDGIWPTPCCAGCPCGTYPTVAPAPTGDQPS